jgi:TP901 family phage tail tape measure protein
MSRMSLDTAIRLSAEVKGGGAIDRVKRSLQDFGKTGRTSKRDLDQLRAATFQFSRANDQTIGGIRNSISAFRGLQEQAKIGGREFKRYGEEIQRLEAKLRGLDGTATKAGASLGQKLAAGLAAAGVGRALQGITAQAANFDAELRKAAAIEGGAGSFDVLRKEIEAVAAVAAGTPTEVAALATALSRAGFSAEQTTKALRGIVLGAEATDTAFDQMGGIVGTILKTFQMDASQTSAVVDILVKSANSANQTVADVGEAMAYAAGQASSLGVSVEDSSALIALFADASVRGSRAGTALATGLNRLQIAAGGGDSEMQELTRGSAKMTEAMARLGASILDTEGNLKPLDQVMVAIKRQMDQFSATDRAIIAKALFGEESGRSFQAVLQRSEADIVKMFRATNQAGGTAEETRKKMRGFADSLKILDGNIKNLTNQIGGMIGAALKPLVDGLNAAIGASQKLPEPLKQIGAAAAAAGLAVTGLVVSIAALKASLAIVGGVTALKGALLGAAGAAKGMAAALLLNPWVAAAAGVAALTVAAYKMNEPFKEFVDTYPERFGTFWRELGSDANTVMQRVNNLAKSIGDFVGNIIKNIRDRASDAVKFIVERAGFLGPAIQSVADGMSSIFSSAFTMIQERWKETVSNMINYSNPLMAMLKASGIDVGGAYAAAMSTDAQRLTNAGSSLTYTVAGVTYSTATGAPVSGTPPSSFSTPVVPPSVLPGGDSAGGGSSSSGGVGRAPSFQPSSRAKALMAAAQKLGISPLDLATIISFETGGTFSPSIRGGAGGNYMGLIQFGGPERAQYGANQNQSFEEQVTGPVVRYFQDRFGKVGMSTQGASLEDLYTTVLAGNPRANRDSRDSFGTSPRSGVANMGPHRQKALQTFFGGSMENVGFDALDQAQASNSVYEQQQQQLDVSKRIREEAEMSVAALRVMNPLQRSIVEAENEALKILQKYSELKAKALSDSERENLAAAQKYEIESNALKLSEQLNKDAEGLTAELEKVAKEAGDRLAFEREYAELLKRGMNPELARQYLEVDKIVEATKTNLDQRIRILQASILTLDAESEVRKEIEKQIKLLERKKDVAGDLAESTKRDIESGTVKTENQKIEDQIGRIKLELEEMTKLANQAAFAADTISQAFAGSFKSILDGSKNTREALSDFFKSIADNYMQMAMDIIAKQLQMIILQTILNAIGGAVSGGGPATGAAASAKAAGAAAFPREMGGPVSAGRAHPVGERGPELFVPYQSGTIIPADVTEALAAANNAAQGPLLVPFQADSSNAAMQRPASSGANGLSVPFLKGAGGSDGAAGMVVIDNEPIRFESVMINSVEYVTRQEAEAIGKRSEQRTLKRMRNNPSTRRAAGIG